jgi:hypothetical protein
LLAQLAVAALYAPWVVATWGWGGALAESHWYVAAPGPRDVLRMARTMLMAPFPIVSPPPEHALPGLGAWFPRPVAWLLLLALLAVPLASALRGLTAPPPRGPLLRLVMACALLPPAAVLAVSPWVPLWLPRYFVFLPPFLVILLAHGIHRLRPRMLGTLWGVVLVLAYAFGVAHYDRGYTKEAWRSAVGHIAAASPPESTVVLVLFEVEAFDYYSSKLPTPLRSIWVSHPEVRFTGCYSPRQVDEAAAAARECTAGVGEVWVVVASRASESRRELARRVDGVAAEGRILSEDRVWTSSGGPVHARRYARGEDG